MPMATAIATRQEEATLCGHAGGDDNNFTDVPNDRTSDEASTQTSVDDWDAASVPGGDDITIASHRSSEDEVPRPAMPGAIQRRVIFVEFCTNPDSRIGKLAPPGVEVVRLTIKEDMTTSDGLAKALNAINTPRATIVLFGALPCTGGSQWQTAAMPTRGARS